MKKNLKKAISLLAAVNLFAVSCYAGNYNFRIERTDGESGAVIQKAVIEGKADNFAANEQITVKLYSKTPGSNLNIPSGYLFIEQAFINPDGSFYIAKEIDTEPQTAVISVNSVNDTFIGETEKFLPSVQGIIDVKNGLNNDTLTDGQIVEKITTDNENLIFDTKIFDKLSSAGKAKVIADMKAEISEFTVGNIYSSFDKHTLLNGLLEKSAAEDVAEILSNYETRFLNLKNESVYTLFGSQSEAVKSEIYSLMGKTDYSDIQEIKDNFFDKTVTSSVKNISSHLNIYDLLDDYKGSISGAAAALGALSADSTVKDIALRYVIYEKDKISTVSDIINKINYAIDNFDEVKALFVTYGQPAGGGGGGGGGGAGAGGATIKTEEPLNQNTSDTEMSVKTSFSDLSSVPWAEAAIKSLYEKGIIKGKAAGRFAPNDKITRAEIVKMLVEATGVYDNAAECDFYDAKNHWAYKYISSAYKKGIVSGFSSGSFGADEYISREDAIVILYRAMTVLGNAEKVTDLSGIKKFSDDSQISEYAKESVSMMSAYGLISGYEDGSIRPKGTLTRAEAAVIFERFLNK